MRGTSGNVSDVVEGNSLLHGQETDAFGDAGYQGVHKRPDARQDVTWHVAMRPGKRKALDKQNNAIDALIDQMEKLKASIRAKVEHPFRVIKRQFGYTKVRYLGLKENTLQLKTLFALSNLWMVRHQLLAAKGWCACKQAWGRKSGANSPKGCQEWREDAGKTARLGHLKNISPVAPAYPSCSGHPWCSQRSEKFGGYAAWWAIMLFIIAPPPKD